MAVSFAKQGAEAGDATGMLLYGVMFIEVRSRRATGRRLAHLTSQAMLFGAPCPYLASDMPPDAARGRRADCSPCRSLLLACSPSRPNILTESCLLTCHVHVRRHQGRALSRDIETAYKWLILAQKYGGDDKAIEDKVASYLDYAVSHIGPEQRIAAERAAAAFRPLL